MSCLIRVSSQINESSDIDLILVLSSAGPSFVHRTLEFSDLREIYPALDLLVYTQDELDRQLADSANGFWKSARLSMRRIV